MAGQMISKIPIRGSVVELMQHNRPLQAWVLESEASSLRLYTITQREIKIAPTHILPWTGPAYNPSASKEEMRGKLELHRVRREEIAASLDTLALWELTQGAAREDALWYAGLLWSEPDIDHIAALGQAMLAQKLYFKFSPPFFEALSAAQVEQKKEKQQQEARLNELVQGGTEFFRKIYAARRGPEGAGKDAVQPPAAAEELRDMLLRHIADPYAYEQDNTWGTIAKNISGKNAGEDQFLPLELALAWGILPEHHNYMLDRLDYAANENWETEYAGICADFFAQTERSIRSLPVFSGQGPFFSIDPASTRDWDDAISISSSPEGYALSVAVACPSLDWPFESSLDKAVSRRASSLYFPEGDLFMLPRTCCSLFRLEAQQERPALVTTIFLDRDMNIKGIEPLLVKVKVQVNLSLEESEAMLQGLNKEGLDAYAGLPQLLQTAYALALALQRKRLDNGAVITERAEAGLLLRQGNDGVLRVDISPGPDYTRSHTLVGEAMILCNAALAQWGKSAGLPLIYRVQGGFPREYSGVWRGAHEIQQVLKALSPARLSLDPKAHAGVGMALYSSFTSPLRRYLDLLNQGQLLHYLRQGTPRLDQAGFKALLPTISARLKAVGQAQRARPRYWKLLYLQQYELEHKGSPIYWEGMIIDEHNGFVSVSLLRPDLQLSGPRSLFSERAQPGSPVCVRVGKINPLRGEIHILEALDA